MSAELMKKNLDDAPSEFGEGFLAVHVCSNIHGRVRRVGIDSSGLNLSSVLGWCRKKWKDGPKDKGWLKLHALCDVDSGEIIAYAITRGLDAFIASSGSSAQPVSADSGKISIRGSSANATVTLFVDKKACCKVKREEIVVLDIQPGKHVL